MLSSSIIKSLNKKPLNTSNFFRVDAVSPVKKIDENTEMNVSMAKKSNQNHNFIQKEEIDFDKSVIFFKGQINTQHQTNFSPLEIQEKNKKEDLFNNIANEEKNISTSYNKKINSDIKSPIGDNNHETQDAPIEAPLDLFSPKFSGSGNIGTTPRSKVKELENLENSQEVKNFIESCKITNNSAEYVVLPKKEFNEDYMNRCENLVIQDNIRKKINTLQEKVSQLKRYKIQINSEALNFFESYQEEIRSILLKSFNPFQEKLKKYFKIFFGDQFINAYNRNNDNLLQAKIQLSQLKEQYESFKNSTIEHVNSSFNGISDLVKNRINEDFLHVIFLLFNLLTSFSF